MEENPLDFPMALGRLGDMSLWLAPDEDDEPASIILQPPGGGFLQSLVPLVEATIRADLKRLTRAASEKREEEQETG
jgi:hypothetical protein